MNYLPQVVRVRYVSGFIVSTRFDDGTEKHIDVSQWFKGPVFEPLKGPKLFKKSSSTPAHSLGRNVLDIAPEALYAARDSKKTPKKALVRSRKSRRNS